MGFSSFLMVSLGTIFGTILPSLVFAVPKLAIAFNIYSFKDALGAVTKQITSTTADREAKVAGQSSSRLGSNNQPLGRNLGVTSGSEVRSTGSQQTSGVDRSAGRILVD